MAPSLTSQVESVRDDPAGRLALMSRAYRGRDGVTRHLPYRRAALSFMRWQLRRGVLDPSAGSPWWRAVNERLLRDTCEAIDGVGPPSLATAFIERPTPGNWYCAHNASIVAGYLEHRDLAERENEVERFFLNVVLLRVLYAHALTAAPRLALGPSAPLGRVLGDPRLGMAGIFLSLGRVLPDRYPATGSVADYIEGERGFGRFLDYRVIAPRLGRLYSWAASELEQPGLASLIQDGAPVYAWPYEARRVWTRRLA